MKIAAISEDGTTVSQHFGRAPYYLVVTVEDGQVVSKEKRDKAGHHTFAANQHPDTAPGERHGYDTGAQSRHATMAQSIGDCQAKDVDYIFRFQSNVNHGRLKGPKNDRPRKS